MPDDKPCLPIRPNQVTCNRGTYGCGMQRPPARPTTSAALSDMLLGLAHDCYAGGMSSADIYKGFEKAVGVLSTGGSSQPPALDMADLIDAMNEVLRISDREHEAWGRAKAGIAKLQAHPEGHSCVFHAVPLVPGDTLGPQTAVCVTRGKPPSVLASQPAAAVSDEAIYAVWTQHCQTPGTTTRQLVCGFARAIPALSPAQHAPEWDGGEPANLQAAARDADEWLALIQRLNDAGRWRFSQPDSRSKLDGCRAALSKILCAPAQQAVPMTPEQMRSMLTEAEYDDDIDEVRADFINGARHAEAHHGITQRADGGEVDRG